MNRVEWEAELERRSRKTEKWMRKYLNFGLRSAGESLTDDINRDDRHLHLQELVDKLWREDEDKKRSRDN